MQSLTPHRDAVEQMIAEGEALVRAVPIRGPHDQPLRDLSMLCNHAVLRSVADLQDRGVDADTAIAIAAQALAGPVMTLAQSFFADDREEFAAQFCGYILEHALSRFADPAGAVSTDTYVVDEPTSGAA